MRALALLVIAESSALHALHAEICAGCAGGLAKAVALHPLDSITTTLEVSRADKHSTPLSEVRGLLRRPLVLYRGLGAVVAGVVPYAILFHTAYWVAEVALTLEGTGVTRE